LNGDIHIVSRGRVASTMLEARAIVMDSEEPLPFAVVAASQTSGLGRQGRAWLSDEGIGLYVTFAELLRASPHDQGLIALAVGVGICDALSELDISPGLKWPNDIVVDDRKLGGVLIQSVGERPGVFLIGVGLNLLHDPTLDSAGAISLQDFVVELPDRTNLIRSLAGCIGEWLDHYLAGEHRFIVDAWTGYGVWLGAEVSIITDDLRTGTFLGIDSTGKLILETAEGELHLASGDVQRGPRRSPPPYT
jgi:BirA family biotin operon repressor/biotin-[acetyl-CoA-carboxylase] ligase